MRYEVLLLFLLVGAGVYLTRAAPLLAALREEKVEGEEPDRGLRLGLRYVGPSVVAALLVVSALPQEGYGAGVLSVVAALVPTALVAVRFRNLGLTVLAGVLAYWVSSAVIQG